MFFTSPKLFYQAVMFGVVVVLLELILSVCFSFLKPELSEECEMYDKYYITEVTMFLTGFILRYLMTNETISKYLYDNTN